MRDVTDAMIGAASRSYLTGQSATGGFSAGSASSGTAVPAVPNNVHVIVKIGDRDITDIVQTEIREGNRATRRAALAGAGRRA